MSVEILKTRFIIFFSFVNLQTVTPMEKIDNSNKGHQLLQKMGWSGTSGLGKREQGIINPIEGGEVRDRGDMYRGVGAQSDPFEQFRKNRSQTYIQRIRDRDEERESNLLFGFYFFFPKIFQKLS